MPGNTGPVPCSISRLPRVFVSERYWDCARRTSISSRPPLRSGTLSHEWTASSSCRHRGQTRADPPPRSAASSDNVSSKILHGRPRATHGPQCDLVFSTIRGTTQDGSSVTHRTQRLLVEAGLSKKTFHICATARLRCSMPMMPTSRRSRTCSGTRRSASQPTPTLTWATPCDARPQRKRVTT